MKILIVDDEEKDLKMLEAMLLPEGYGVVKAKSGEEALRILKSENVLVVLLDILMPGLSGYDVLKTIREDKNLDTMPVIILTALTSKEERIKGLELGADDFISKPLAMEELRAKIYTQVKLKYLRRQLTERAKLLKVINKIGEGVIVSDKKFAPVNINIKAGELLGIKAAPVNIMNYLKDNYNEDIQVSEGRKNYILKQKLNLGDAIFLSLTIDPIKDVSGAIDSYIFIFKKIE
ncbi:MAG: hypothetical protein A2452_12015 [Candidatus Firestonebacteria bacterium RIFOXYC2_FULL_39_67]|nr:MAG: hypothetical protein A2536_00320 [Candidatus Firestonebacteria bacterium RIFOXYD2_FULL_39_29]OGF55692.1 MAG: hypothetical protein A2452_12015 [Candidatus Firestonebacteria bacterium RIFOXYC2_FULL_39_67]OGF57900.1 MAG: hypothetical protein A2497_04290 [Candidatus Firestonebacteria bacterium RifOxyC12_full_39_7]